MLAQHDQKTPKYIDYRKLTADYKFDAINNENYTDIVKKLMIIVKNMVQTNIPMR